ncbi:peptide chain release factor N(5)-glutamine methyltransferase [Gracilibacillus timonensis]|uniref:peptide chain release factor N(5)-glutamine methyltransferase n=1 Tax=Gracilibacillus timonensis TaxID=1816696 RepID=UPI0008246F92|nr:peptide chain release factor N(5)-glutamine methyltransferase [Gracilibacillus timonensis]
MVKTIHEALNRASSFLEESECETKVAEILLLDQLQWTKTELITRLRDPIAAQTYQQFMHKVEQHARTKVPVQHLTGKETFFGREFYVSSDVLIPRPETEELVQQVLQQVEYPSFTCVDVGTGSGVIAITLAKEWAQERQADLLAVDISDKALQIAKRNATLLKAPVCFYQGDFLKPLIEQDIKIDILVSNPPYISYQEKEELTETVRHFDPELALFAENNGLYAYQKIIQQAAYVMNPNGWLFFEIGYTQAQSVTTLIQTKFPMSKVTVLQDINGKDRIIQARL